MGYRRANVHAVLEAGADYETVAASATAQVLGATGGIGDNLSHLICVVTDVANAQVQVKEVGGSNFTVLPATVAAVGTYAIQLGVRAVTGAGWAVTTGSGVTVVAVGDFT